MPYCAVSREEGGKERATSLSSQHVGGWTMHACMNEAPLSLNLSLPSSRSAHRRDRGQARRQTGRHKDNSGITGDFIGGLCQGDRRSIIHVTVDLGIWEASSPRLLAARFSFLASPGRPVPMIAVPTQVSDRIPRVLLCCPEIGRDAMLSEMTNVNGDMFGWMAGWPWWPWPWGEPRPSFWGRQ